MPIEDNIVDQGEDLDFDPSFDNLFYSAGLDDCLFNESEYRSTYSQVGDQDMWSDHCTNECNISFCGGITRAWNEGKTEIEEIKRNLRKALNKSDTDDVSKSDIVKLFYGKESRTYRAFHDKVGWPHNKFLSFIKTCLKLSEYNFTTTHAYATNGMMDCMMEKGEYIRCFEEIHAASSVESQLTAAREDSTLWKELQKAFNIIARKLTVIDRSYQVQLVDNDKEHFKSVNRSVYEQITIKKVKHIRDNRYGHVIHTMATGASQLATCAKYEENGEITNSVFEDMVTKISFGHNTASLLDLTGLMLGYDREYIFRDFVSKMVDYGARIHSTLKRCPWAPITYDQNINDSDRRTLIPSNGIPCLLLKHATLRSSRANGVGTKLTVGAYRNGMGSVCMLMSTEYHTNHWDIIHRHLQDLKLYKYDRSNLHKKGFKLSSVIQYEDEDDDISNLYFELF